MQAGARKKCQTKDIYLVTRLLPLITQHCCLCSVLPSTEDAVNKVGEQTEEGGKNKAQDTKQHLEKVWKLHQT